MKLVVSGSRSIKQPFVVVKALYDYTEGKRIDLIVCGGAKGVDRFAMYWAIINHIPFKVFYPNYGMYGKIAPLVRNEKMASYGHELLAIWDGKSRGTIHMVQCMQRVDKPVTLIDMCGKPREPPDKHPQEEVKEDVADEGVEGCS